MKALTPNQRQNTSVEADSTVDAVRRSTLALGASIQQASFWTAILLPLVYLPLLGGLGTQAGHLAIGLLGLNLVALFVGHSHNDS
jgi:hypothetical protein